MTKAELIKALEPFTDELEVLILDTGSGGAHYEIDSHHYAMRRDGEGVAVLTKGALIVSPKVTFR